MTGTAAGLQRLLRASQLAEKRANAQIYQIFICNLVDKKGRNNVRRFRRARWLLRWTPLSRPKNGDPSLHSHQALVALIPVGHQNSLTGGPVFGVPYAFGWLRRYVPANGVRNREVSSERPG